MKNIFFILLTASIFFSCEETIILDAQQVAPVLVIESHLTTEKKLHNVKLSLSVDFYFDKKPPAVTDAIVSITDLTTLETYEFKHNQSGHDFYEGVFISEESFQGVVGHTYELRVNYDGELYTGQETILPVIEIEELKYRQNISELSDPKKEGYFYEILLNANEPQETDDYYMFKFYRNDSLIFAREADLYFTDDEFLGERIKDLPLPIFFSKGDKARVEMYSITRQAFIYLNDLIIVMHNDSGMFSPPPANPRNNLTNGAMGYFMASDVSDKTIMIE
jgi:hypothetical protein